MSPLPSRRMPSLPARATPAFSSTSVVIFCRGIELFGVDRLLDAAQIHFTEIVGEDVVEAALGQRM